MDKAYLALGKKIKYLFDSLFSGKAATYNPAAFWEKRHRKYKSDFRAVANETADNDERYKKQREQFLRFLKDSGINISGLRCIEFGCGNGFWGGTVLSQAARSYHGLDISHTAVENCRKSFPSASFECVDVSNEDYRPSEPADLVFSIDVTQHVVEEEKLARFLGNMAAAVRPGGHVVVTSYTGYGDKYADEEREYVLAKTLRIPKLRWVHTWDLPSIKRYLSGCKLIRSAEFWDKTILAFVKETDIQEK